MSPARRLLVRLPSWLGDFIMVEPVVRALHQQLDSGEIERLALAAPGRFFELFEERFEGAERIDAALPERGGDGRLYRGFDCALFLDGSARGPITALSCGVPERIGWASGVRRSLFSRSFRPSHASTFARLPRPFGEACIELAGLAGITVRERRPLLRSTAQAREAVEARLDGALDAPFHVLRAGGRAKSAKALPVEWLAQLRDRLVAEGKSFVVICGPDEASRLQSFLEEIPPHARLCEPALGLGELVALAERAQHHIGADSGSRHVFEAAGCPGSVLFGPTDPRHTWGRAAAGSALIEGPSLECRPCHKERCALPGETQDCFLGIDPASVPLEL